MIKKPELLAPAGTWASLNAALNAGADAIYFGIKGFNMRVTAKNFEKEELPEISKTCHENNAKAYLALNTIIYENELIMVEKIIKLAKKSKIDAIICWDFAVINMCKKHNIPFHISTQASISNSSSAEFFKSIGAERIVLARECSLSQIKEIRSKTDIEIETFIHGAMCVSISGRCFISQHLFKRSANRGDCLQPCRREYIIKDAEEDKELLLGKDYVMSAKDLCTIRFIDLLISSGINSLKIEGRTKSPEYMDLVVNCYRQAIDLFFEGKLTENIKKNLYEKLQEVYNRGFSSGFYLDAPSPDDFAHQYGSKNTKIKAYCGTVENFYKKPMAAEIKIIDNPIKIGDEIIIIGPTTGCIMHKVTSMQKEDQDISESKKGWHIGIILDTIARKNDKVYIHKNRKDT